MIEFLLFLYGTIGALIFFFILVVAGYDGGESDGMEMWPATLIGTLLGLLWPIVVAWLLWMYLIAGIPYHIGRRIRRRRAKNEVKQLNKMMEEDR